MSNIIKRKPIPSVEYLNICFTYDKTTGFLYWKERPSSHFKRNGFSCKRWNNQYAGKKIESIMSRDGLNYYRLSLNRNILFAHRVIYKMLYNAEPECIDHIDGNGLNNTPENIRAATNKTNNRNRRMPSNNSSGITGVSWSASKHKWMACISLNNKTKFLGHYNSPLDAEKAYLDAKSKYGFHENHGLNKNI